MSAASAALDRATRRGLISRMRNRLLPALTALLLTLTARAGAQTALQLRWELVGASITNDFAASRAAFTLTNRGPKPLPPSGWAIYYNALHSAQPGSVAGGFTSEDLTGDLHRLVPAAAGGFAGLAPGASIRISYLTHPLPNRSFVPKGPYIVFDDAKDVGVPLSDYVAAPFERRVATPESQFALDSVVRVIPPTELPPVFPTPVEVTPGAGALRRAAMPPLEAPEALRNEAAFAAEYLRPYFGATAKGSGPSLRLEVGPVEGQTSSEAYSLVVDPVQGVRIVGVSPAGVFYGLQSLRSLLPAPTPRAGVALPAIRVVDAPRFGYRGFISHADYVEIVGYASARHIEVIPEIEMPGHARAAITAMKANEQYRLNDPEDRSVYTSVQGYPDNVMNPALESTYRFIERVVGDLAAMHREAGAPLRHIHMGGDEVPAGVWVGSPAVQAYMQAHGLTSVEDFWFVFYGRVEQILKAQGLLPSGWEEIAVRKTQRDGHRTTIPNPDFAARGWRAYVWNNVPGWGAEDLAYRLANGGYDVVLSPVTNFYFDLAWNQNPEETGLDWGGYIDLHKPFDFIPLDYYRNTRLDRRGNPLDPAVFAGKDRLTDYGRAHIMGIQGNLWSETLGAEGLVEYMLVPREFALAERAWAPDPDWARERDPAKSESRDRQAWSRLGNVVCQRELPRLDREVPGLNYRIPTPGLKLEGGAVRCSVELPGFTLRYTTDGSEPTVRSAVVRGPIPLRGTVRVAAFTTTGRKGQTARVTAP